MNFSDRLALLSTNVWPHTIVVAHEEEGSAFVRPPGLGCVAWSTDVTIRGQNCDKHGSPPHELNALFAPYVTGVLDPLTWTTHRTTPREKDTAPLREAMKVAGRTMSHTDLVVAFCNAFDGYLGHLNEWAVTHMASEAGRGRWVRHQMLHEWGCRVPDAPLLVFFQTDTQLSVVAGSDDGRLIHAEAKMHGARPSYSTHFLRGRQRNILRTWEVLVERVAARTGHTPRIPFDATRAMCV